MLQLSSFQARESVTEVVCCCTDNHRSWITGNVSEDRWKTLRYHCMYLCIGPSFYVSIYGEQNISVYLFIIEYTNLHLSAGSENAGLFVIGSTRLYTMK